MGTSACNSRRFCWLVWFALLAGIGSASAAPADTNQLLAKIVTVRVAGLKVDGPWTTNDTGVMTLRLAKPARLEISYGPVDSAVNQPLRLLRKLEGVDADWQEAGGQMQRAEMQLMVLIHDAANRLLSHQRFTLRGVSKGWRKELEQSEFQLRRESLVLPSGASRLQVLFTAENWTVLGSAALTDFRVLHRDASGREENLWPDPMLEEGENLDQPDGTPRYWQRSGFGHRMAQVLKLPPPATGHAVAIVDDDVRMSATWQADLPLPRWAHPGDTLTLTWREAFSVGIGERSRATFEPLPPGEYVFRVKTVTPWGDPVGRELALTILIPQPVWKRPAVVIPVILAWVAALAGLVWLVVHRRMSARMRQLEHHRALERERLRIARDIHDDLGASLTHMNLLSQTVLAKVPPDHPAGPEVSHLRNIALRLTEKLDEIVWAVNPRHDTVESLVNYLTAFTGEFLGAAGIRARVHVPLQLPAWSLPSALRHNVFLATKEILHNVVKHAHATEVHLRLAPRPAGFDLTIEDNGRGFAAPRTVPPAGTPPGPHGQGLAGVRARMEALGGQVSLDSTPGGGTRVVLSVPLNERQMQASATAPG